MNCPKCFAKPSGEYLASTDQLWCEFEAEVIDGTLHTVYYCRRCDWHQEKCFNPELIHLNDWHEAEE